MVHLHHPAIVPSVIQPGGGGLQTPAEYVVEILDDSCVSTDAASYSAPLLITQPAWGDVVLNLSTCPAEPPNVVVDITGDVVAAIKRFANQSCAPKKTRVDVEPGAQDFKVNITDVVKILEAFSGTVFPFPPGDACPFG